MNVCPDCFGELGLKNRIVKLRPSFDVGKCAFHPTKKGVPIEKVAEIIDHVFRSHYGKGEFLPKLHEDSDKPHYEQDGDELQYVLQDLTDCIDLVSMHLPYELVKLDHYWPPDGEEAFYEEDQYYVRVERGLFTANEWRTLVEDVKYTARFFSDGALGLLDRNFLGVENQKNASNKWVVHKLNKGDVLYRSRSLPTNYDYRELDKNVEKELGPPPKELRKCGRMNSAGIRVFYGAFDKDTSIAEIRPVVGSEVAVGEFILQRDMWVLDLTRFQEPIKHLSLFNEKYIEKYDQWSFMQMFMFDASKPIHDQDENIEYVPTQVVAEYLSKVFTFSRNKVTHQLDGIVYRSSQMPGKKNIALFDRSSEVSNKHRTKDGIWDFLQENISGLSISSDSVERLFVKSVEYQCQNIFSEYE